MTSEQLRSQVAAFSLENYEVALWHVRGEVRRLESLGNRQAGALEEARLVCAEVYQKMGRLTECERELDRIKEVELSTSSRQGFFLIRAKVAMQRGDVRGSAVALDCLEDKLGPDNMTEIGKTFLWRKAFILGLTNNLARSARMAGIHLEQVELDGFQRANNLLYAKLVPALVASDSSPYSWRPSIAGAREAGSLYLRSSAPFLGRINNRVKSVAQALITEGMLWWKLGEKLSAFRLVVVAGGLLRDKKLGTDCEGIGELVGVMKDQAMPLAEALRISLYLDDDIAEAELSTFSDSLVARIGFHEAREIVVLLIHEGRLTDIYAILHERY